MKQGYLSQYFEKVAAKRLSSVESDPSKSNQHEFNGNRELKRVLGTETEDKQQLPTTFLWIAEENEAISADGSVTWYDARKNHKTRSEYRLYFKSNSVTEMAKSGDMMIIAKRTNGTLMIIITAAGSSLESQLLWLFHIPAQIGIDFEMQDLTVGNDKEIDFTVRFILDELGIDIEEPEAEQLDSILAPYNGRLPSTKEFSQLARNQVKDFDPIGNPDGTLMAWMSYEEKLFRRLERFEVEERLKNSFVTEDGADVDGFLKFSLSIQNRRKSRAGLALENHLEAIFQSHKIKYERTVETEFKVRPDFLFPGAVEYHNPQFPSDLLTMLGVKTTCKDRWRQVLSEASRIDKKHLLTLEPGISENQTNEMKMNNLQLVLPSSIHDTYKQTQKKWLLSINEFVCFIQEKQRQA